MHSVGFYVNQQSLILVTRTSEISGYIIYHIQSTVDANYKHFLPSTSSSSSLKKKTSLKSFLSRFPPYLQSDLAFIPDVRNVADMELLRLFLHNKSYFFQVAELMCHFSLQLLTQYLLMLLIIGFTKNSFRMSQWVSTFMLIAQKARQVMSEYLQEANKEIDTLCKQLSHSILFYFIFFFYC